MLGGVFGDSTGIAPGYTLSLSYKWIELFTQGEYFIDAATRDSNFFYTWTELSAAPVEWLRLGLVIDRTKAFGSDFEVRRGPCSASPTRKLISLLTGSARVLTILRSFSPQARAKTNRPMGS